MSEEETNQTQTGETNPEAVGTPSGDTGASVDPTGESQAAAAESHDPSAEEIAAWRRDAEAYKELQPAFTRQSQDLAVTRARLEEVDAVRQALAGQQAAQTDPIESAWLELQQAEETFDPALRQAALRKVIAAENARAVEQAELRASNRMRVERGLESVGATYGPVDPQRLAELKQTMTPEDELRALALLDLEKSGKLPETLLARQKEAEQKAHEAKQLQSILAGSGGRMVPGALQATGEERPQVPASVYYGLSKKAAEKKWPDAIITPG